MPGQINIVLADDHPLFRAGVKYELECIENFHIVGEAGNGNDAVKLILEMKPHVAVLDIQMPGQTGLEVIKNPEVKNTGTKIILLTMFDDDKMFAQAIDNGVKGYVLKDDATDDIVNAVRSVCEEKYYISPALSGLLVPRQNFSEEETQINLLLDELTSTEMSILKLLPGLKSNEEIARELNISKRTVENHKVNIAHKLNLDSAKNLLKFALQNKDYLK